LLIDLNSRILHNSLANASFKQVEYITDFNKVASNLNLQPEVAHPPHSLRRDIRNLLFIGRSSLVFGLLNLPRPFGQSFIFVYWHICLHPKGLGKSPFLIPPFLKGGTKRGFPPFVKGDTGGFSRLANRPLLTNHSSLF